MIGTVRVIWEEQEQTGQEPYVSLDTDEFDPPRFLDLVARHDLTVSIGPAASNTEVAIPDACALFLFSDEPVSVKLYATGNAAHTTRHLEFAGDTSADTAWAADSIYLTGNGSTTAKVRIVYWETV